jgi:ParB/RepB/Spo0J family partition protein
VTQQCRDTSECKGVGSQSADPAKKKTSDQPAGDRKQAVKAGIILTMIATSKVSSSDYNPNEMTEGEFRELVAEVRHLGVLPKPLVVRPNGEDHYDIVDGEHGLKAAMEVGMAEVPCEVRDMDDFEAMRQTYKRNRHGTDNRVLLGRMFEKMMALRKLTQRALAKKINVSEASVRNALLYVRAAKVRKHYAPDEGNEKIAGLTVAQVRAYVELSKDRRDAWLDAGADLAKSKPTGQPRQPTAKQGADETPPPSTDAKPSETETPTTSPVVASQGDADETPPPRTDAAPSETETPAATPEEASQGNDEATSPIGQNSACPEPRAQEEPTNGTGSGSSERGDTEGPEPPAAKEDREALDALRAAWKRAPNSVRRAFLTERRDDPEAVTLFKEVMSSSNE